MNFYIKDTYLDTKVFMEFIGTPPAKIYFYLLKYAITAKVNWHIDGINLYDEYFRKGHVVSRYSQNDLSVYLDLSQSAISKRIKSLNDLGFVKTFKLNVGKERFNIYKLGDIINGKCTLLMDKILTKSNKSKQISDMVKDIAKFGVDITSYGIR